MVHVGRVGRPCLLLPPWQDRWLPLSGVESGLLRVRTALVPGTVDSPSVKQMVALLSPGTGSPVLMQGLSYMLQVRRAPLQGHCHCFPNPGLGALSQQRDAVQ